MAMRWLPALALTLWAAPAAAQTWTGNRTTPVIDEIVAVDATGEPGWLYGQEDLAGDGVAFMQQEQSIDIRTAYAVSDNARFWARVYVSDQNVAGGNVTVLVFIDTDRDAQTGGGADAAEIDAQLVNDPSNGGYEFVIEIAGNATISDIWAWDQPQGAFVAITTVGPNEAVAEAGQDLDPIGLFDLEHGYLQSRVDLGLVGLTSACNADLYFRSVTSSGNGDGDLDVGTVAACTPVDANDDGVPDVIDPPGGCESDADCPADGICVDGECFIPDHCIIDGDCAADEVCTNGICFPQGGGMCSDANDCVDLVCSNNTCTPCASGSGSCGPGRICGPDGRCLDGASSGAGGGAGTGAGGGDGLGLLPGDNVQGGAFTCALGDGDDRRWAWFLLCLSLGALAYRRGRRDAPRS
jgi:hypothetical protein